MSDELYDATLPEGQPPVSDEAARVGFCQDCGKPLTAQTVRTVGTGVFCEPCLATRVAASSAAAGAAGYANVPPAGAAAVPPPPVPGSEHPVLACLLGLIPGVGAIYNGQFAKGVAHIVIFVLLKLLADVAGVFSVFVAAWIFYQMIDAYQTANARLLGLPLPNPFGLNDIGERMGFGRGWPNGAGTWGASTTPPPPPPSSSSWQTTPPPPAADAGSVPVNPPPVSPAPDWVGYIPPTHFAGNQPPYQQPFSAPYTPPGTSVPYTPVPPPAAVPGWTATPTATSPSNTLPVAALILIVLGALILIANMLPHWRVNDRWFPPLLLAGLAVWIFLRRLRRGASLVRVVRGPLILMLLAIYFGLKALFFMISFGMFIAVILIAFGVLLLLERVAGAGPAYAAAAPSQRASFVPAAEPVAAPAPAETTEGDAP